LLPLFAARACPSVLLAWTGRRASHLCALKTPKVHTTPWTIFLYTNNHLRHPPPSKENIPCILELRPIAPSSGVGLISVEAPAFMRG
jgi:hypothetical protein